MALEESVLKLLNHQINNVADLRKILEKADHAKISQGEMGVRKDTSMPFGVKEEKKGRQAVRKKEEIQKYTRLRMGLYEDYKDGLITKEEYLELKEIYGKRIQTAEQMLDAMEVELAFLADGERRECDWISQFKKYGRLESISREVAVFLIEQILVYEKKEGERYPRIEIHFKYADEFQDSLSIVKELHGKMEGAYGENE